MCPETEKNILNSPEFKNLMNISEGETGEQRALAYKLLADCYKSPDETIFETFRTLTDILKDLGIEIANPEISEDLETLMVDHARLFVGPSTLVAPPYGSMYLEHGNQLMTESTLNVKKWYASEGMDVAIKDIPDHIRIELEFMYYLAFNEIQAGEGQKKEWKKKQHRFLGQHLARWIKDFDRKVNEGADTAFYKKLAGLTRDFILQDFDYLHEMKKES